MLPKAVSEKGLGPLPETVSPGSPLERRPESVPQLGTL